MSEPKPIIPKYVMYEGILRMGFNVNFHRDLLPKDWVKEKVQGGGRVALDLDKKALLFYCLSAEFNECEKGAIIEALPKSYFGARYAGYKIFWAPYNKMTAEDGWAVAEHIYTIPE